MSDDDEKRTIDTFLTTARCLACHITGWHRRSGNVQLTNPLQWLTRCGYCGDESSVGFDNIMGNAVVWQ